MQVEVDEVDREILARPEVHGMLVRDFAEAVRAGADGMTDDMAANHGRSWGFALGDIEAHVHLWFCERDRSVPAAMGRYLAGQVPGCEATFVAGAGNLWILVHLREDPEALVGPGSAHEGDQEPQQGDVQGDEDEEGAAGQGRLDAASRESPSALLTIGLSCD